MIVVSVVAVGHSARGGTHSLARFVFCCVAVAAVVVLGNLSSCATVHFDFFGRHWVMERQRLLIESGLTTMNEKG